jgi:hypothetical protein
VAIPSCRILDNVKSITIMESVVFLGLIQMEAVLLDALDVKQVYSHQVLTLFLALPALLACFQIKTAVCVHRVLRGCSHLEAVLFVKVVLGVGSVQVEEVLLAEDSALLGLIPIIVHHLARTAQQVTSQKSTVKAVAIFVHTDLLPLGKR